MAETRDLPQRRDGGAETTTPEQVIAELHRAGLTVAVAESLTGGLLCGRLTEVAGASSVVRGGVIVYSTESKHEVLGVSSATLELHGAVSEQTAREMATAVQRLFVSRIGISTTGVAGPDRQEEKDVGTVFLGIAIDDRSLVMQLTLEGTREQIRAHTVNRALAELAHLI